MFATADKTKKIRIKVVYNKSGYTTLPNYAQYTFVESMDIPTDKSKIRILSIDTMERPQADKEVVVNNPFLNTTINSAPIVGTTASGVNPDMPF